MRALVLLSAGRHPVSGKPGPTRAEMQAARLAAALDPDAGGLHAGPGAESLREALGRGLTQLTWLRLDAAADPVPALAAALREIAPDVALAGAHGEGGEDSGLAPYALAHALGWPLIAGAVALASAPGGLVVTQAVAHGARREVIAPTPAIVTVHEAAPAPLAFAHGRARAGRIVETPSAVSVPAPAREGEIRPYRARPRALSANAQPQGGGRVLINPDPQTAARAILDFLREIGVLDPSP